MISNLKLLNPKAISNEIDLDEILPFISKIILNNNDPLLEITLCYPVTKSYSLYILISFIGVEIINIVGWNFENKIQNYEIDSNNNIIDITLESGHVIFKYEWANIESIKKILNGNF